MQKKTVDIKITIAPAASDLVVDATGVPTSGTVGQPFSGSLAVSGGTPPYTFSLDAGALPDGVSLNSDGSFSGTPTAPGDFAFTVGVTDSSN